MSTKTLHGTLSRHLRRLHTHAQNTEEQVLSIIEQVKVTGTEANQAEVDFSSFAASFTNLILTVHNLTSSNQELGEALKQSLTNKVANAIMVAENMDILAQVDYIFWANQTMLISSYETVENGVKEMASRGEEGREKLEWLSKALKRAGVSGQQ